MQSGLRPSLLHHLSCVFYKLLRHPDRLDVPMKSFHYYTESLSKEGDMTLQSVSILIEWHKIFLCLTQQVTFS